MSASSNDAFVKILKEVLDKRGAVEADVKLGRIVGRATDGSSLVLGLDGECVSRGDPGGFTGEIVVQIPSLLDRVDGTHYGGGSGHGGGGGVILSPPVSTEEMLWVDSIAPAVFSRGATLEVLVTGKGFTTTTVFQFLLPDSEDVHPGVTVNYLNFTDSEHVTLGITVAAEAELVTAAPLAFGDPSRRF